jgi:hypothetical protein
MRKEITRVEARELKRDSSRRERRCLPINHPLCETKISDLDVSIRVEEEVLWFEITIDDILAVEVLECEHDLSSKETGHLVGETTRLAEM